VVSLFGPARTVSALCNRHFDTRTMEDGTIVRPDVEDSALVNLWLNNRMAVVINANWNGSVTHHATRRRATVIGREGSLHFGVEDGGIYVQRPDGDYIAIREQSEETQFDGYPSRRISPGSKGAPSTIVGDFVNLIKAADTSMRSLEMQIHVMEIIFEAYRSGAANEEQVLKTRF